MFTVVALRAPPASERTVSTLQSMLLPSDPWFTPSSVDWYEPVDPELANFPACALPDGTARDRLATPEPNESIWLDAPTMLARLRSRSVVGPLAHTMVSR